MDKCRIIDDARLNAEGFFDSWIRPGDPETHQEAPMDKLERLVEPPLTDEDVELARRFVESARKSMLDRLPDDVIGGISKSHMIFGLACAAHAVSVLRPEAADEITRLKGENERLIETLEAGAVCMSPTERVRWIDRATTALRSSGKAGSDA